jgi:outer membrane protein TolC
VPLVALRHEVAWGVSDARARAEDLTLQAYLERVLEYNESVQVRMLELEISRQRLRGEKGIFEPTLATSYEHLDSYRPNTVEQRRQQYSAEYIENNNIFTAGVEMLASVGTRIRLASTFSDLNNNLQQSAIFGPARTNGEFMTFVGVNVVQPMLKNGGPDTTLAGIRLAAVASDVAFQDYRRQTMEVLSRAESLYWQLYFAQEQLRFLDESVAVAENLLKINRARQEVGSGSDLEVMEAESGLALRRSKQAEALQKLIEVSNGLISLYSTTIFETNRILRAVDSPAIHRASPQMFDCWRTAMGHNPDYLNQRKKVTGEEIRVGYTRNQTLPELNLRGSYGWYGLGENVDESWYDMASGEFPAWTVGVEFRVPLGGGMKTRGEYAQARLRRQQVLLQLHDIETQIVNGLDSAIRKVGYSLDNVSNYEQVVGFYQNLFDTQRQRLEVGAVDSQTLLETEARLFEAKNAVAESLVQHERAWLELELVQGTVLARRHMEMSQTDLERRTGTLLTKKYLSDDRYRGFLSELKTEFERQRPDYNPNTPTQQRAVDELHRTTEESRERERQSQEATRQLQQKALEVLRRFLEEQPQAPPNAPTK